MKTFSINNQEVAPGENKTVILNSYELHTKSSIKIPVHVIRSKKPGPTILFSAGLHGEETNGIEIIRKLVGREELQMSVVPFMRAEIPVPDPPPVTWIETF